MTSLLTALVLLAAPVLPAVPPRPAVPVPNPAFNGCRTKCGLYAPLAEDCDDLQKNEDSIIKSYAEHVKGWTAPKLCEALQGWVLVVNPYADQRGVWAQSLGFSARHVKVYGCTDLDSRAVFVGLYVWRASALAHELGHVFLLTLNGVRGGHEGWTRLGLCDAINKASNLEDDCTDSEYMQPPAHAEKPKK